MASCVWVFFLLMLEVYAQYPVLYIPFRYRWATVEDMNSGDVLPVQGAYHKFFCSSRLSKNLTTSCERDLIVHSQSEHMRVRLRWINKLGQFDKLPDGSDIRIYAQKGVSARKKLLNSTFPRSLNYVSFRINSMKDNVPIFLYCSVLGQTVNLTIVRDTTPPKANILLYPQRYKTEDNQAEILVKFSERVYPKELLFCNHQEPLDASLPRLDRLLETSKHCKSLSANITSLPSVSVTGGLQSQFQWLHNAVYLTVSLRKDQAEDIQVDIRSDSMRDLAGNSNKENLTSVIFYRPIVGQPNILRQQRFINRSERLPQVVSYSAGDNILPPVRSKTAGAVIGKIASGAVAGTIASSASGGGATGAGGQSIPFFLLNLVQKLYLTGNVAVADMPDLYADFAGELGWAMFDFPSPFESFVNKEGPLDNSSQSAGDEDYRRETEMRTITDAYIYISRVFFWVPLATVLLLTLHLSFLAWLVWRRKKTPFLLAFPRLELILAYWSMPAVATAAAGLYRGDRRNAMIATWLLILLPGSMLVGSFFLLLHFFYSKDPKDRNANFVVLSGEKPLRVLKEITHDWKRKKMADVEAMRASPILFLNGLCVDDDSPPSSFDSHSSLAPLIEASPSQNSGCDPQSPFQEQVERQETEDEEHLPASVDLEIQNYEDVSTTSNEKFGCCDRAYQADSITSAPDAMHPRFTSPSESSRPQSQLTEESNSCEILPSVFDGPFPSNRSIEVSRKSILTRSATDPKQWTETSAANGDSLRSSVNNCTDSGHQDPYRTIVSLRPLTSLPVERGGPHLRGCDLSTLRRRSNKWVRFKRAASTRLKGATSNNVAAALSHGNASDVNIVAPKPLPFERAESSSESEGRLRRNALAVGFSSQPDFCDSSKNVRSSHHHHNRQEEKETTVHKKMSELSFLRTPMVCTAVPTPALKSLGVPKLLESYKLGERITTSTVFKLEENITDKEGSSSEPVLDCWSQTDTLNNTRSMQQVNKLSGINIRHDAGPSRSYSIHKATIARLGESPAAVQVDLPTILEAEAFAESRARLSMINKECLMDINCDYLVDSDTESSASSGRSDIEYEHTAEASYKREKQHRSLFWTLLGEAVDVSCYSIIFGRPQLRGKWRLASPNNTNFISQYGYLFEDFRGHPVLYRKPTYRVKDGALDRGKFVSLPLEPLLDTSTWRFRLLPCFPRIKVFQYQIQLLTRLLGLLKIVVLGCLVAGVGSGRDSYVQVIILFFMSLLLLLTLRVSNPYKTRFGMAVTLMEDASDVAFLALAGLLLLGPREDEDFRRRIGVGMLTTELSSLIAILADRLVFAFLGLCSIVSRFCERKPSRVAKAFQQYLRKNAYFLQRKYFDRWMIKALKRGLYNREARREELSFSYLISEYINCRKRSVHWFRQEIKLLWKDFCAKAWRKT